MSGAQGRSTVAVVGAGLAGLCCALHLQARGIGARIFEADDAVGGRVRTDGAGRFRLDRGFQVLPTSYSEVRAMLDLDALRIGRFEPGARIFTGDGFAEFADPLRRPGRALRTLTSGVATPADALRLARMWLRVRRGEPADLLERPSIPAEAYLRGDGFSERVIERFFRPFFGSVFLDRALRTSSRALEFVFRTFSDGDAALPAGGMGALPAQLAARLAPDTLRLRAPVARVRKDAVLLEGGEQVAARAVVIATGAGAAARLVPGLPAAEGRDACCLYFDAPRDPDVGRSLVLDGTGEGPVDTLCVPSAVAADYAPEGRALVSASVRAEAAGDGEALVARARSQLARWFGSEVSAWELLRVVRVRDALPLQAPGPLEPTRRSPRLAEGLFACGDHRDVASLEGAMGSGRRAAEAVAEALG